MKRVEKIEEINATFKRLVMRLKLKSRGTSYKKLKAQLLIDFERLIEADSKKRELASKRVHRIFCKFNLSSLERLIFSEALTFDLSTRIRTSADISKCSCCNVERIFVYNIRVYETKEEKLKSLLDNKHFRQATTEKFNHQTYQLFGKKF